MAHGRASLKGNVARRLDSEQALKLEGPRECTIPKSQRDPTKAQRQTGPPGAPDAQDLLPLENAVSVLCCVLPMHMFLM